jgi:hypothetical protein
MVSQDQEGVRRWERNRNSHGAVRAKTETAGEDCMTHVYRIRKWLPDRHGQPCRLLVPWSRNGNVLIEFADGVRVVCSRWSIRKAEVNHHA